MHPPSPSPKQGEVQTNTGPLCLGCSNSTNYLYNYSNQETIVSGEVWLAKLTTGVNGLRNGIGRKLDSVRTS